MAHAEPIAGVDPLADSPPAAGPVEADRLVRRSPFSANPAVGPRGQRTQQRILDAALEVFDEEGYHATSIDRITRRAGCSRASFYQYFGGKDDVFAQLAAQVARQVIAATDALDRLTADTAGWAVLRAWVVRYAEIYHRSVAVFRVFDSSAETAPGVAAARATAGERAVSRIQSKLHASDLPPRELDAVVTLLVDCVGRTLRISGILRDAAPAAYSRDRMHDALTDVLHRTLFGRLPEINEHPPGPPPLQLPFTPSMRDELRQRTAVAAEPPSASLDALLSAGREVFSKRGFAATRVDDIVTTAGLSHGVFYRYFPNLTALAHVLVRQAMRPISAAFSAFPDPTVTGTGHDAELRGWLRRYNTTHAQQEAIIRVWMDASLHEPELGVDSGPALDWGRRQLEQFLRARDFGDTAAEAVVMLALLDAFGAHERSMEAVDAVAHVIERGFLGLPD